MDAFAGAMIARGPTLGPDRASWTGSVHILDLPDAGAARAFAQHEPYNRAGLYAEHRIRRFGDRLGRTMWEFPGGSDEPRFLVFAAARGLRVPPRERLIVHGELLTADDARPAGVVLALQAPGRKAVGELLGLGPPGPAAERDVEVLDWEFGGRR